MKSHQDHGEEAKGVGRQKKRAGIKIFGANERGKDDQKRAEGKRGFSRKIQVREGEVTSGRSRFKTIRANMKKLGKV